MSILEILKVIVLGMVEGFTEWLPISSTGHLILVEDLIRPEVSAEFMEMFRVVIQLGAILAVVVMYFRRLNPFDPGKSRRQRAATWQLWMKILIACLPAAILGFLLDDWLDEHLFNGFVVALMLVLYGILFLVIENRNRFRQPVITKMPEMNWQIALYIGMFQCLALIPGTSRSGATILGAMLMGCSRKVSAEFSFFLGIPVMLGASVLKIAKFGFHFTGAEFFYLILGMVVAFIVSVYSIRFLLGWIVRIWYGISSLVA